MQESQYDYDSDEPARKGLGNTLALGLRWAGSLLSVALVLGGLYWAYALGQRDASEVPVIRAMEGAARITPDEPGGTEADHQGLEVNEVLASDETTALDTDTTLAPPPQRLDDGDATNGTAANSTSNPVVVDAATRLEEINPVPEAPAASDGMTVPLLRPDSITNGDPLSDAIDSLLQEIPPEEGDTSLVVPEVERSAPQYGNIHLDPGAALIQLGAFSSLEDAGDVWNGFQQEHNDLLAGLARHIQPIESGGRLLYQLQAAGFDGLNETNSLCVQLADRGVDCISVIAE